MRQTKHATAKRANFSRHRRQHDSHFIGTKKPETGKISKPAERNQRHKSELGRKMNPIKRVFSRKDDHSHARDSAKDVSEAGGESSQGDIAPFSRCPD